MGVKKKPTQANIFQVWKLEEEISYKKVSLFQIPTLRNSLWLGNANFFKLNNSLLLFWLMDTLRHAGHSLIRINFKYAQITLAISFLYYPILL